MTRETWTANTDALAAAVSAAMRLRSTQAGASVGLDLSADVGTALRAADKAAFRAAVDAASRLGITDASVPAAGYVGESMTADVASGSPLGLTTNTPLNLATLPLTAGEWEVSLAPYFAFGATTNLTRIFASISLTSATLSFANGAFSAWQREAGEVPGAGAVTSLMVPPFPVKLTAPASVYGVVRTNHTVSTAGVYGRMRAVRVG